jgi:hypothetical protein
LPRAPIADATFFQNRVAERVDFHARFAQTRAVQTARDFRRAQLSKSDDRAFATQLKRNRALFHFAKFANIPAIRRVAFGNENVVGVGGDSSIKRRQRLATDTSSTITRLCESLCRANAELLDGERDRRIETEH